MQALEILIRTRIGHAATDKTRALILDENLHALIGDGGVDANRFALIKPIAMLDGVDGGLFQCELDAEDRVSVIAMPLDGLNDLLLGRPRLGEVGDEVELEV